ncbi:MspA family porin [Nocardia farcinica]|nr:MspA family porin [Nocardia farcinica]MBF6265283.1 MspA family porin [Nocardia farcinica]MBF6283906.1 MspA family porin [Nocardia farcinica]MBF6308609.1 MspA family porin [Nocardia farcinica]MBF6393016.1 MspA family porin [Nocardia farcinica]MBF6511246.1 MspA family porin [Nocardia farcinica]
MAVDVSSGLRLGVGASLGGNAGVTVSGATLGARASLTPNTSATLAPGKVSTVEIRKKPLTASRGSITAEGVTINVDACLGPVTIRSVAAATIRTSTADSTVTVYGDTIQL